MATGIRFPKSLPPPSADGYGDTYEETRSKFNPQGGAPRMRQRMRATPKLIEVTWLMTESNYREFDQWFVDALQGGTKEFDIQLLDDDEQLVWYTGRWLGATYRASINEEDKWQVSGTIRAVADPFDTRPSGTDELEGFAAVRLRAVGTLLIPKVLFGYAGLGLAGARGVMPVQFRGRSVLAFAGIGQLAPRPVLGQATFTLVAQGQLLLVGDPELVLQFDGTTYTEDNGGTVDLQFGADVYYPPHII